MLVKFYFRENLFDAVIKTYRSITSSLMTASVAILQPMKYSTEENFVQDKTKTQLYRKFHSKISYRTQKFCGSKNRFAAKVFGMNICKQHCASISMKTQP